jgi:LPS sulfotransferase NodH
MIPDATMPSRGYLICSLEQTGSNVLAEALTGTGQAGRPRTYFDPMLRGEPWMRDILGDSAMSTGMTKILRAGATPNGIFGAVLCWSHFRYLAITLAQRGGESSLFGAEGLKRLLQELPRLMPTADLLQLMRLRVANHNKFTAAYEWFKSQLPDLRVVWLRRNNMVARAIAQYRELHSGKGRQPGSNSQPLDGSGPDFDLAEIHQLYGVGLFHEEMWQWLFKQHNVKPHRVIYEDLVADHGKTVRGVLDYLDIGYAGTLAAPSLPPEADGLSTEWELRYRKQSAEAGL